MVAPSTTGKDQSVIVVGGGAWGLPAALHLQDLGYAVTLLERFAPGNPYASSGGSSRLWRLADTQIWRSRAMIQGLEAMRRLSSRLGTPVFRTTGMLWRDDESLDSVTAALTAGGIDHQRIKADDVGSVYPGLRPDGRDAIFTEAAGVVHADRLLQGCLAAFVAAGGQYRPNSRVVSVSPGSESVEVSLFGGSTLSSDQVLVSAGPGTRELLNGFGLQVPLRPYIEEVVYLGDPAQQEPAPDLPGLVDCPIGDQPGVYAMPNQERGFKIGLDKPLRALIGATLGDDLDRAEVADRTEEIRSRVERDITSVTPHVLATQVCTWTDSGDGDFVIGRVHPRAVVACGDSGEGFKFSAFMGEYLASLVDGAHGDEEFQQYWSPSRFERSNPRDHISAIGRH